MTREDNTKHKTEVENIHTNTYTGDKKKNAHTHNCPDLWFVSSHQKIFSEIQRFGYSRPSAAHLIWQRQKLLGFLDQ